MKNLIKPTTYLILMSFILSSCGVMFGGSKFSGSIVAKEHPNAQIFVNGTKVGQGTAIGLYNRNRPLTVELKQAGCDPKTQTFDNTFRPTNFILNLVSCLFLAPFLDLST